MSGFYRVHVLILLFSAFIDTVSATTGRKNSNPASSCLNDIIIGVLANPPYTRFDRTDGVISDFIRTGLKMCFKSKSCTSKGTDKMQWRWVQSVDELENLINNEQTSIAFPVPPSLSSHRRISLPTKAKVEYFSVLNSPGPTLIVNYQACQRISNLLLIQTMLSVWPILVLTLLLAGVSGVCIWALEYHNVQCKFSKPFVKGSYDGFWWAVVSMTTVGYGDQIPRSIVGRLFGITWILTGVTLIAVFTASITSAITVISVKEYCTEIQGQHIAVLNNSEVEITARHHGATVKAYDDVMTMFNDLKSEKVNGIMMDRLKAYYYLDSMGEDSLRVSRVVETSISYSVAVIPGNMSDVITSNSCFMGVLSNPRGKMNRIMKKYIVPVKPMTSTQDAIHLFSHNSGAMTNTLLVLTALLVLLLICGIVWDRLFQTNACFGYSRHEDVPRQVLTNTNDIPMTNQSSIDKLIQVQSALKKLNEEIDELRITIEGQA